ncbi:MAG: BRO family protein [Pseudomonadota bacterium]
MNAMVQSFGFGERLVRVVDRDDAPWFVANDVCAVLEIGNAHDAVARLDDDERDDVGITDAIGRDRRTTIISESGVYALVFTSRKAVAKQFRKWVTSEVLPAIRSTGRYDMIPSNDPLPRLPEMPDDFDRERLNLQMVREARIAFGAAAARRMWEMRGLPDLSESVEVVATPLRINGEMNRSISQWLEARCEFKPGARHGATQLFGDYVRWCRMSGDCEPLNQVAFGRFLTACGVHSVRSNIVYRSGLTLRKDQGEADGA